MFEGTPLAERQWHEDCARRGGEFPPLEPVTQGEVRTLQRVRRVQPDAVGRRVVVTREGQAIWHRRTRQGIVWYVLGDVQDRRLLAGE